MQQRQAVVAKTAARYQRSRKKEKSKILSELVELTEYSRAYARRVLRQHGQRLKPGKQSLVVDVRLRTPRGRAPVLRREGESGADQDLESDGLHLRQAPGIRKS
jgi:hypothetical protein